MSNTGQSLSLSREKLKSAAKVDKRMANAPSFVWFALLLLMVMTRALRTTAAKTTVVPPLVRTLQQQQQQQDATTSGQELDITYEFRLFIKLDAEELSTQTALTLAQDAFSEHLMSVDDSFSPVITVESLETQAGSACTEETFTLNAFAQCVHARSVIRILIVNAAVDALLGDCSKNLQRAILSEVQDYVDVFNAQHGDVQMIYDYPISVESNIVFTLKGANRKMDETEQDLFLTNFRIGFEPIMDDGAYEWSDANIVLQLLGRTDGEDDRRFLQQQQQDGTTFTNTNLTQWDPDPNEYNKVSMLLRAICSGETCQSENFHNFVLEKTVGFVDEFLLLLQMVDVPQAVLYFARISAIYVDDSAVVAPLNPDNAARIVKPEEEKIPSWVWILLAVNVFILLCAVGWVRYRIYRRREARKGAPEPPPLNESDGQLQSAQDDEFEEQESFPNMVEGDTNDGEDSGYGQGDDDYSQISGGVILDEANA